MPPDPCLTVIAVNDDTAPTGAGHQPGTFASLSY